MTRFLIQIFFFPIKTLTGPVARESHQPLVFSSAMEEGKRTDIQTGLTVGGLTVAYPVAMGRPQACSHRHCDCSYTHQDTGQLSHVLSLGLAPTVRLSGEVCEEEGYKV